jgi:outer membrane protein OmpA-like peptidoglycan-associated protein
MRCSIGGNPPVQAELPVRKGYSVRPHELNEPKRAGGKEREGQNMSSERPTFYQSLNNFWQNNKAIAIAVFCIVVLVAGFKFYEEGAKFIGSFSNYDSQINNFNKFVQPIYFVDRTGRLAEGQKDNFEKIVLDIKRINPKEIVIKSHTSRLWRGYNIPFSKTRGEEIRDRMIARGIDAKKISVVPYGGRDNQGLDKGGYVERVEVELLK